MRPSKSTMLYHFYYIVNMIKCDYDTCSMVTGKLGAMTMPWFFFPARSLSGRFASLRTFSEDDRRRLPKPLISRAFL